jgi:hypothetical protein
MPWPLTVFRILKNADKYPGKHNTPTERTNPNQKPLEAKSQVGRPPVLA